MAILWVHCQRVKTALQSICTRHDKSVKVLPLAVRARGGMADTPDLGSGPERGGGSSPLARTIRSPVPLRARARAAADIASGFKDPLDNVRILALAGARWAVGLAEERSEPIQFAY